MAWRRRLGGYLAVLLISALLMAPAWAGNGAPCGSGPGHPLPEPTALALLGAGVAGLLAVRKRRARKD